VVLKWSRVNEPSRFKAGNDVAAMVEGRGTTLKHFKPAKGRWCALGKPPTPPMRPLLNRGGPEQVACKGSWVAGWRQV